RGTAACRGDNERSIDQSTWQPTPQKTGAVRRRQAAGRRELRGVRLQVSPERRAERLDRAQRRAPACELQADEHERRVGECVKRRLQGQRGEKMSRRAGERAGGGIRGDAP